MTGTDILITVLGGITLLLWGCRMVRTGVLRGYGGEFRQLIARWSGSRFYALGAGIMTGTALQSSTAAALLIGSFVGQGAIGTAMALAIILGADFGSAFAALIFSSGIANVWPFAAFLGYVLHTAYDKKSVALKNIGRILIGLGILLLGLRLIGSAASELSSSTVIANLIEAAAAEPVIAILIGALLTWMAYSSIAIVLFAVTLASAGVLPPEHLFPLILGVNLGGALPALTATWSDAPSVRRIPLGNLMFRAFGVIAAVPLLAPVSALIAGSGLSPGAQIIGFHLAFNAALCLFFIGFTGPIARLLEYVVPTVIRDDAASGPRYLNVALISTPSAALGAAARETLHMGEIVEDMLAKTMQLLESNDPALIDSVASKDDEVDDLHEAIKFYLTKLLRDELNDADSQRAVDIISFTTNLEHVGDIVDKNLLELANKKRRHRLKFSSDGLDELKTMHARVMDTFHLSLNVFMSGEPDGARQLLARKTELRDLELSGTEQHIERLRQGQVESIVTSAIHLDVLRDFKRINSHLTSVAYPVLERAGELRPSRLKKKALRQVQDHAAAQSQATDGGHLQAETIAPKQGSS